MARKVIWGWWSPREMAAILPTLAGLQRSEDRQHSKLPTKGLPVDTFPPSPSLGPEFLWAPPTHWGNWQTMDMKPCHPAPSPAVCFFETLFESQMLPHMPASARLLTSTLQCVLKARSEQTNTD